MYFLSSMRGDFQLSSTNVPLNEPHNVPFNADLNEIPTWRGLISRIKYFILTVSFWNFIRPKQKAIFLLNQKYVCTSFYSLFNFRNIILFKLDTKSVHLMLIRTISEEKLVFLASKSTLEVFMWSMWYSLRLYITIVKC